MPACAGQYGPVSARRPQNVKSADCGSPSGQWQALVGRSSSRVTRPRPISAAGCGDARTGVEAGARRADATGLGFAGRGGGAIAAATVAGMLQP